MAAKLEQNRNFLGHADDYWDFQKFRDNVRKGSVPRDVVTPIGVAAREEIKPVNSWANYRDQLRAEGKSDAEINWEARRAARQPAPGEPGPDGDGARVPERG